MAKRNSEDRNLDELNGKLTSKVDAAMSVTQDWVSVWQTALTYIFGNQRYSRSLKDNWDDVSINYIFPAMMQDIAFLMQRDHKIIARPFEDNDVETAEAWSSIMQYMFNKTMRVPDRLLWSLYDMKVFGYSVSKHIWNARHRWNPREQKWDGDVVLNFLHPQFFGADPNAEFIDDESCEYVTSRRSVSKEFAMSLWGNTQHGRTLIERSLREKPDNEFFVTDEDSELLDTVWSDPDNEVGTSLKSDRFSGLGKKILSLIRKAFGNDTAREDSTETEMVTIEEIYMRDYELESVTERGPLPASFLESEGIIRRSEVAPGITLWLDAQTGEPLPEDQWPEGQLNSYKRPQFPNGRYFVRINNEILNRKKEDQIWPYEQWPYTVGVNMAIPHVWQGLNIVEPGRGIQDLVNITTSHMLNYVKSYSDPRVKVEENANPDDPTNTDASSWLQSASGSIIKLNEGAMNKVEFAQPANMSSGLVQFYSLMTRELQSQTGQSDPSLGREAGGQQTATEARVLATNARMRTALHSKLVDRFLILIIRGASELMQRNYTPGRIVRVLGEDSQIGSKAISQDHTSLLFDIELEVGSTLPFDEEIRKQELLQLVQIFGPSLYPDLLRAFKVPNIKEVLKNTEAFQQLQAFLEKQQQLSEEQQKLSEDVKKGKMDLESAKAKMDLAKSLSR